MSVIAIFSKQQAGVSKIVQLMGASSLRTIHNSGIHRGVTDSSVAPVYLRIREKYKQFQIEDGTPVHLKAGKRDVYLMWTTFFLLGAGLISCAEFIYSQAFPKKN